MKKQNEYQLKDLLNMFANNAKYEKQLTEIKLLEIWKEQMGKTIAKHTISLNLYNNTLYIKVDSSILRNELHMNKQTIKDKLNAQLGKERVMEISLQ